MGCPTAYIIRDLLLPRNRYHGRGGCPMLRSLFRVPRLVRMAGQGNLPVDVSHGRARIQAGVCNIDSVAPLGPRNQTLSVQGWLFQLYLKCPCLGHVGCQLTAPREDSEAKGSPFGNLTKTGCQIQETKRSKGRLWVSE